MLHILDCDDGDMIISHFKTYQMAYGAFVSMFYFNKPGGAGEKKIFSIEFRLFHLYNLLFWTKYIGPSWRLYFSDLLHVIKIDSKLQIILKIISLIFVCPPPAS